MDTLPALPPVPARPHHRFPSGQVVLTRGVFNQVNPVEAAVFFSRHMQGDWGDVSPEDAQANEQALENGERLISSYTTKVPYGGRDGNAHNRVKVWVITERDRSATTLLLPEEY